MSHRRACEWLAGGLAAKCASYVTPALGCRKKLHLRKLDTSSLLPYVFAWAALLLFNSGCRREFYRRTADRDAYGIIQEKGTGPNWNVQPDFSIQPDPRSRFYDPTCSTDPRLPLPAPQINRYQLPPLVTQAPPPRNLGTETGSVDMQIGEAPKESVTPSTPDSELPTPLDLNPSEGNIPLDADAAEHQLNGAKTIEISKVQIRPLPVVPTRSDVRSIEPPDITRLGNATRTPVVLPASAVSPLTEASPMRHIDEQDAMDTSLSLQASGPTEPFAETQALYARFADVAAEQAIQIPPIPVDAWQNLPPTCIQRMLEFPEIRVEYARSFGTPVTDPLLDPAPRVNLENLLEIALINNRDYQRQKESLYRAALRVNLQRFNFDLRFTRRGNGSSANYVHNRPDQKESNDLTVRSRVGLTKSLYTGGELISSFANDVLLTFGSTNGFESEVGTSMLIELSQPIIQRDIQFEPLIQSERDLVYAARAFVRYRKALFRDQARNYYALLLNYRQIAISTQAYFSNLDGFNRAEAYYLAGRTPRFQVDQFEQNVLSSRGELIDDCNALESQLDLLKLSVGLPPEMPLNLDLTELEQLTLSDEATVIHEQIRRSRTNVANQIQSADASLATASSAELARRMLRLIRIQVRLNIQGEYENLQDDLAVLAERLELEEKRIEAKQIRLQIAQENLLPLQLYLRNEELLTTILQATLREIELFELVTSAATDTTQSASEHPPLPSPDSTSEAGKAADFHADWLALARRFVELSDGQADTPQSEKLQRLPDLIARAEELYQQAEQLQTRILQELNELGIQLAESDDELIALGEEVMIASQQGPFAQFMGLAPLEVNGDQAMLTALVQRLDLMNVRGQLADAWRDIKYTGDALRSILDINASQRLGTTAGDQDSSDRATTQLSMSFDSPLNRREERNNFRLALIDYNVALRNLIDAQDNTKLEIRNDLRALQLDRNQYENDIASAALADERVISTRIQFAFGQGNITARDFLESQTAYTQALSRVAGRHIAYIRDRIEFFLDLEQLQVDPLNFWSELRNEQYPFIPNTDYGGTNPDGYGRLPDGPWYSECLRRMNFVPVGVSSIHRQAPPVSAPSEEGAIKY